jgi:hypothetical protein
MNFRQRWLRLIAATISLVFALAVHLYAAESSSVVEAKRSAAQKMAREGKLEDAISLLNEVVASDSKTYRDYLALARLQDKLGRGGAAKTNYRLLLNELGNPRDLEERQARAEAEKRTKALDANGVKIDATVEAFLTKLDAIEKEAMPSKDTEALDRLFRLKGSVLRAEGRMDTGYCEVPAGGGLYTSCGLIVRRGDKLHVWARGTWATDGVECSAAGRKSKILNSRPYLMLLATIEGKGSYACGEESVITITDPGQLMFYPNLPAGAAPVDPKGMIMVLVRRE